MVDVKTCLDNAQEKMDMAIMYLEEGHISAPEKRVPDCWTVSA